MKSNYILLWLTLTLSTSIVYGQETVLSCEVQKMKEAGVDFKAVSLVKRNKPEQFHLTKFIN